jgi:hypothetical protein
MAFDSYPDPEILMGTAQMRETVREWLLQRKFVDLSLVNPDTVDEMLQRQSEGTARYGWLLAALVTLAIWLETWG